MRNRVIPAIKPSTSLVPTSPAAFFTFHQGTTVGTSAEAVPDELGTLGDLATVRADATQWGTAGFWTGGASDQCYLDRADDTAAWDSVFALDQGYMLIGLHVLRATAPASAERFVTAGFYDGFAGTHYGLQIRHMATGNLRLYVWDDDGTEFTIDTGTDVTGGDGKYVFFWVDNRATGSQTMNAHTYDIGTDTVSSGTPTDISACGNVSCVSDGTAADVKLVVGAEYNSSNSSYVAPSTSSVRRLWAFNFGQNPPSDVSALMKKLSWNHMLQCQAVNGI